MGEREGDESSMNSETFIEQSVSLELTYSKCVHCIHVCLRESLGKKVKVRSSPRLSSLDTECLLKFGFYSVLYKVAKTKQFKIQLISFLISVM